MNSYRISLLALAIGAAPLAAHAQDASWNVPYGANSAAANDGWDGAHRDENGNLEIVNGIMGGEGSHSTLAKMSEGGVGGYRAATSTAIGNQLNVVTTGSHNTVIVDSTQINNGAVTAGAHTTSTTPADGESDDDEG